MRITLVQVLGWSLPLLGVVLGVVLGAYLSNQADSRRWKRDWIVRRIEQMTTYHGEVCESLDEQVRLTAQSISVVRGQRSIVRGEQIRAVGERWGRVLARRGVSAQPDLQRTLIDFDQARADAAEAVNARDDQRMTEADARLKSAREDALRAINAERHAMNEGLAPLLLPRRTVLWRKLRRKPLAPESIHVAPISDGAPTA